MFEELMNKHEGAKAYVLGKGPSLDKFTQPDDGIVIGVNNVGNRFDLDYVVCTDGYEYSNDTQLSDAKTRLVALPYRDQMNGRKRSHDIKDGDIWFLHCHDIRRDGCAARLTKEQVRETRWLYTASSSIQPAIHLAWYLGCTSMELYGVDGGGQYEMMIPDTVAISNRCFGKNWSR
jgi:hypothetical protein